MSIRRAVTVATSLVGLTAAGVLSLAVPAQAYPNTLDCSGGPGSVNCFDGSGGRSQYWEINGVYYPDGDNQDSIYIRCQRNTWVGIVVHYIGGDGYGMAGASVYCGLVQQ